VVSTAGLNYKLGDFFAFCIGSLAGAIWADVYSRANFSALPIGFGGSVVLQAATVTQRPSAGRVIKNFS
jgi:hypothetical protein